MDNNKEKRGKIMGIITLSFIALLITACSSYTNNSDRSTDNDFYTNMGGFDYQRIPLFPPYQATKINKKSWSIDLHTNSIRYQPSINDIVQIGVGHDLIISYGVDSLLEGVAVDEAWFVIVPSQRIEKGFSDFDSMVSFVQQLEMNVPNLQNADGLYEVFTSGDPLDWFPD